MFGLGCAHEVMVRRNSSDSDELSVFCVGGKTSVGEAGGLWNLSCAALNAGSIHSNLDSRVPCAGKIRRGKLFVLIRLMVPIATYRRSLPLRHHWPYNPQD